MLENQAPKKHTEPKETLAKPKPRKQRPRKNAPATEPPKKRTGVIPDSIKALVPESAPHPFVIIYQATSQIYYIYQTVGQNYNKETKRMDMKRKCIGRIKDNIFEYSKKYKLEQENEELRFSLDMEKSSHEQKEKTINDKNLQNNDIDNEKKKNRDTVKNYLTNVVKNIEKNYTNEHRQRKYNILQILIVMILASLGGYTGATALSIYWKQNYNYLKNFFNEDILPIVPHDVFNHILRLFDPNIFIKIINNMVLPFINQKTRYIHIDGQAIRASKTDKCTSGRYIFNAFDSNSGMLVHQLLIDEKENEISRGQDLLEALNLSEGDIISADALNTQLKLVEFITNKNANYIFAVKNNQSNLAKEIIFLNEKAKNNKIPSFCAELPITSDHGRIEQRFIRVISGNFVEDELCAKWKKLRTGSIIIIDSIRQIKNERKIIKKSKEIEDSENSVTIENGKIVESIKSIDNKEINEKNIDQECYTRLYISSLNCANENDALNLLKLVKDHWSIESMHWVLDLDFGQDRMQMSNPIYIQNRSILVKNAFNIIKYIYKKTNGKYSLRSLLQMMSNPSDAVDTLGYLLTEGIPINI